MIKNCQQGFKPIQFLSLHNGKAICLKYPDSLRAHETAPILVAKLRKYSQDGKPLQNVSTKSKNQQPVLYQGERCFERGIPISSLTDAVFFKTVEETWKNYSRLQKKWTLPDYPDCCWKHFRGCESSYLKSVCSCSPDSSNNQCSSLRWFSQSKDRGWGNESLSSFLSLPSHWLY